MWVAGDQFESRNRAGLVVAMAAKMLAPDPVALIQTDLYQQIC